LRSEFLPFHVPQIEEEEIRAVVETLRSGWLTTGPKVGQLQEEFAEYVGASHAVALNSGTAALHLALEAAGITEGDEVLVPTMTFAATAQVVLHLGAKPVLVDSQPDTLNIDPELIQKAITSETKAIIPVHYGGHPCDMAQILEIAKRHGLWVIEDAAHAVPARYRDKPVGAIGDATCFSFYVTKTIATGEGGMVTTENPEWAERIKLMSLHGMSRDAWKRSAGKGSWYYEILDPGFKCNMTDIAAAIGIGQLGRCDQARAARSQIVEQYNQAFEAIPEVETPTCRPDVQHAWHLYLLRLNLDRSGISRDQFIEELKARNIGTSVHFIPIHVHPYYRDTYGYQPDDFPVAYAEYLRSVSLPLYPGMTDEDVDSVIEAVGDVFETCGR
jgi:dTDP-4-amino-4,6-dideoxygalactose transaminase